MTPVGISLAPLTCLRCQQPVPAQPDEVVWVCATCGQGMLFSETAGLQPLAVHYTALPPNSQGKPVWVVAGSATLQRETFSGNNQNDMLQFWAQPRWFFIPAYQLGLEQLVEAGARFLKEPLPLQEGGSAAPFLPVTVPPEDVAPLAEFIVLAVEADRRDKLKELTFTLQLGQPELWIFP